MAKTLKQLQARAERLRGVEQQITKAHDDARAAGKPSQLLFEKSVRAGYGAWRAEENVRQAKKS